VGVYVPVRMGHLCSSDGSVTWWSRPTCFRRWWKAASGLPRGTSLATDRVRETKKSMAGTLWAGPWLPDEEGLVPEKSLIDVQCDVVCKLLAVCCGDRVQEEAWEPPRKAHWGWGWGWGWGC
jgi:hypothetical protein